MCIRDRILSQSLSVRDTEALVRGYKNPEEKTKPQKATAPPFAKKAKKELTDLFETSVEVKVSKSGKGQLVVPFKNKEDFERILKLIKSEK